MKIILEGVDNSGKTTLANHILKEVRSATYHHPGGKPEHWPAEQACCVQQLQLLNIDNVILDRITPISQQIYNPDPGSDLTRIKYIAEMRFKGAVFIYCRPSTDRLMRVDEFTWREGESEEHKQKIIRNQHRFIDAYDRVMGSIPHITYDYENPDSVIVLHKIIQAMQGDQSSANWIDQLIESTSCR